MGSPTASELFVVDFTNEELKPGSESWASACNEIRRGLEIHGCFIALYDKVSPELDKAIFQAAHELFDLPIEVKAQNIYGKPLYGYIGQNKIVPLLEAINIDCATTHEGVQTFTNLMWPKGNSSFSENSFSFAKTAAKLKEMVIKMLFESYGVDKYSDSYIESIAYLLRFLKYREPEINETTMGMRSHTDISFLTIIYQNQISGLEIRTRDGEWIAIDFPPKSFVVMAGETCKAWSNGRVHSPIHKVTLDANEKETRYTVALFSFPSQIVEVQEELVDDKNPLQFKPFDHADLLNFYATDQGQKSQNILKDFCGI